MLRPAWKLHLSDAGEPIYGERDAIDISKLRELDAPFWMAGGYGHPEKLREALAAGAAGVQVGTAFEFTEESGLREDYKRALLAKAAAGEAHVFTDPLASPTGFPFRSYACKVAIPSTTYTREGHVFATLVFCANRTEQRRAAPAIAVPPSQLASILPRVARRKTQWVESVSCNALMANIGHPQIRNGPRMEKGLVTAGDDLSNISRFLAPNRSSYNAADVIAALLAGQPPV